MWKDTLSTSNSVYISAMTLLGNFGALAFLGSHPPQVTGFAFLLFSQPLVANLKRKWRVCRLWS